MPPFVLSVLKVVFLALLYFFVYRALHAVVVDLRGTAPRPPSPVRSKPSRPKASADRQPRSLVVVDEDGTKKQTLPLQETLQVGRADACQIRLSDTYVSSFHARIFSRDGSWFVEDLGSTNGTYLNQRRITAPAALKAGDKVRIGKTTLELRR